MIAALVAAGLVVAILALLVVEWRTPDALPKRAVNRRRLAALHVVDRPDPTQPGPPIFLGGGQVLQRANGLNWGNMLLKPGERAIGTDYATGHQYMRYDDGFPPRLVRVVFDRDTCRWLDAETGEPRPRMTDGCMTFHSCDHAEMLR